MTTPNPFLDLGYPAAPMAHPLLAWWRQNVLRRSQGAHLVAVTFTFERWDGLTAGPKVWEWRYNETEDDLLNRRRDVLATLLALDAASPLPPPPPRCGLTGVFFGAGEDDKSLVITADKQIDGIRRTDPLAYRFSTQPPGTYSSDWPLPAFVIVDIDTPWAPPAMAPYPWIDPSLLVPATEAPTPPATLGADVPELPDLTDEDELTDDANRVHVNDNGEPLCGATTGMMIDIRLGAQAAAQMNCEDCDTLLRVEAGG